MSGTLIKLESIPIIDVVGYDNVFITSDQHFFHRNIIKYQDRPFNDIFEMNNHIIECYNKTVKENDLVINLGDLMFGRDSDPIKLKDIIKNLNGSKILIRGNHDNLSDQEYLDMGFIKVYNIARINDCLFCHYPFDKPAWYSEIESKYSKLLKHFRTLYYGHVHSRESNNKQLKCINCCVDFKPNNYLPVRLKRDFLDIW